MPYIARVQPSSPVSDPLQSLLVALAEAAGPDGSVAPEQVARAATGDGADWRKRLPDVRRAAVALAEVGRIEILRKGKPVPPGDFKGVWRLRITTPT